MRRLANGLMAIGLGLAGVASAQKAPPSGAARFAYLVEWSGRLTRVRLSDGQVVGRRQLPSLAQGYAPESRDGPSIESVAAGPGVLLFVHSPDPAGADQPPRLYSISSVTLPGFARLGVYQLPRPTTSIPKVVVDWRRRRALVHWTDDVPADTTRHTWTFRLVALRLPDLQFLREWVAVIPNDERPPTTPIPLFSERCCGDGVASGAVFGSDSSVILNQWRRINLLDSTFNATYSRLVLRPPQEAWAARALSRSPTVGSGYAAIGVDAAGASTLWDLSVDSSRVARELFLVSALGADTAHAAIEVPYSTGFLAAGGRVVVTEEIDGSPHRGTSSIRKVGTVRFFDAATGQLISTIKSPRLAGGYERVRFLCGSDDGRILLFKEDRWNVVLVEPFSGRVRAMSPKATAAYGSTCFIQSR